MKLTLRVVMGGGGGGVGVVLGRCSTSWPTLPSADDGHNDNDLVPYLCERSGHLQGTFFFGVFFFFLPFTRVRFRLPTSSSSSSKEKLPCNRKKP